MIDEVTRIFIENLPSELEPRSQRALIKALIMVTYADRRIRSEEVELLDRVLAEVDWGSDRELAGFVARQRVEIEQALERGQHAAVATEIAAGVDGAPVRRALYLLCDKLANADDEVDGNEREVLAALVDALK